MFVLSIFVVISLFNRWLSALSQSLSWTSFKARAELVWISPGPTCSIRNISFEGSATSTLMLQPWFWFKNWRKSLVSPREVKWNSFLWVEGYLFGSWLPLRLNFSNAGGFPVYMHLLLSSGKEGIGLYTVFHDLPHNLPAGDTHPDSSSISFENCSWEPNCFFLCLTSISESRCLAGIIQITQEDRGSSSLIHGFFYFQMCGLCDSSIHILANNPLILL